LPVKLSTKWISKFHDGSDTENSILVLQNFEFERMADILPIRPWRYNNKLSAAISTLISPLSEVISEQQRLALYQQPFNSIHLTVPRDGPESALKLLQEWKREEILVQDDIPAIYIYYQYFTSSSSSKQGCRKGFICNIRTYDGADKIILRSENTSPDAANDQVALLEKTELHSSLTHGLYTDPDFQLETYMDEAITDPLYVATDYQGARNVLAVIHDAAIIKKFISVLADKSVILADGYHHYESALIFKQRQSADYPGNPFNAGYNFHLMYLTNTEGSDLEILPTHRLIKDLSLFKDTKIIENLNTDFFVSSVDDTTSLQKIITGEKWTFGIILDGKTFKIQLKPESFPKLSWALPEEVKQLDLTVLHYFIIEKIFGLPGKNQRMSGHVDFNRSISDCVTKVTQGEAQMAIITNPVTIEDVKRIYQNGHTMPQNSMYFYPKVISGFLFTSISEPEFAFPSFSPF